jgi:hypothetical protein
MSNNPTKKRPGIFNDPWRTSQVKAPISADTQATKSPEPPALAPPDDNGQTEAIKKVHLSLPNYGGLTITGTDSSQQAAKIILEFCIKYLQNIEPVLLQYGIVVVKLNANTETNALFFIQRSDGWILAIPEAKTRDQGLLQLIQAFLALQANPVTNKLLQVYHIQPHKQ